jgi:hypothetical protein
MTIVTNGDTDIEFRTEVEESFYTGFIAGASRPISRVVEYLGERDAILKPDAMEPERAYTYRLDGIEYVAIKRRDHRLDFYELPSR